MQPPPQLRDFLTSSGLEITYTTISARVVDLLTTLLQHFVVDLALAYTPLPVRR